MVASEFDCATLSMSNVNADCEVWQYPHEVFIKKIQYRIILHL